MGVVQSSMWCESKLLFMNTVAVHKVRLAASFAYRIAEPVLVLLGAEVWDVTIGQQVVNVHEEVLLNNLVVCHQQNNGSALGPCLVVKCEQVLQAQRVATAAMLGPNGDVRIAGTPIAQHALNSQAWAA